MSEKDKLSPGTGRLSPLSFPVPKLPEDELKELNTKRSSIKGQITKFGNYLEKLTAPYSPQNINELILKLNKFSEISIKFDEIQTRIEVLNSEKLFDELDVRDTIEANLHSHIASAQEIIEKFQSTNNDRQGVKDNASSSSSSHCHHDCNMSMGFKLPQIEIHKFDGAYYRWLEFRDTYESLIHKNDSIQPIHKFHYLSSYLEGEAARVISNLEISDANYSTAWDLLCERFNNNRQLVNNHLNSLLNIEPIQRESDRALRYLSDHISKNLRALKTLGLPTDQWDTIIVHLMASKLDQHNGARWEEIRNKLTNLPTLVQFKDFLKNRADVLEGIYRAKKDTKKSKPDIQMKSFSISASNDGPRPCVVCKGKHRIFDCNVFKSLSVEDKWAQVTKLKLCHNCLRPDHETRGCRLGGCRVCKRRHNTILHKHDTNTPTHPASLSHTDGNEGRVQGQTSSFVMSAVSRSEVLLSTALIDIVNPNTNKVETVRALLDSGSQSSFITNGLRLRLQLASRPSSATSIIGIGDTSVKVIPERCSAQIRSKNSTFTHMQDFLVLPQITNTLPKRHIDIRHFNIPSSIILADPTFNQPSQIDVLLGADIFWQLIAPEQRPLGDKLPILHNSKLGWLIAGPIAPFHSRRTTEPIHCNFTQDNENIESQLTKFWEYEDFPNSNSLNNISTESERHFLENTHRLENGKFCVRLPLIDSPDCLGDNYTIAKGQFLSLEKRFRANPVLKGMYSDFIQEYRDLGHLSDATIQKPHTSYFLPHHAVLKENSESTKLRVVFNASSRTSSGFSINDLQMVGPNIQDSLFNILLRFRNYKYVLSGDIEKQYRQIVMNEADRDLQMILWREKESLPIRSLKLHTVTYGFASASFLAARCLWQLGEESADPLIKDIIQHDFYCDDLLCGAQSEADLLYIKENVSKSLLSGGFNLRKYRSNSHAVIESELENKENKNLALSQSYHTLGLGWNPNNDVLHFDIADHDSSSFTATKRSILSTTFKIFDPVGILTMCTVKPKILLQKLWTLQLGWDDPVPPEIQRTWANFIDNVKFLKLLTVPRNVLSDSPVYIELHCFCDASQAAYGACIYIKSTCLSGKQACNLLCAKSRVAPTKSTTIPRLELCAALLAARLSSTVTTALRTPIQRCVYWSDSSVVLAWLQTCPMKLKTYVGNRVAAIQELTESSSWRHVPTAHNPADLASRGVDPQHAQHLELWWHGPSFLLEPEDSWPNLVKNTSEHDLPEVKATTCTLLTNTNTSPVVDFDRFSSLKKMQRVYAFVLRFISIKCKKQNIIGPLSVNELENSLTVLVKAAQQQSFDKELSTLHNNKALNPKSSLASLCPYIDSQGILRVGGRLDKSNLAFPTKHPILLHSKHSLTKLIFEHKHTSLLHAGPQLMLASVREQFWPIGGRDLARRTARACVTCRRHYGKTMTNIMGNLPSQRLVPDFPFSAVAVDFAGPFMITDRRGRGCKISKCYLCLFICLRYKCVHLEAVSELSKDCFILTLRRFIARRGKPREIFCDNGRNFVSSAKEINEFFRENSTYFVEFATDHDIKFKFSPAYAPNFNGYAEAGIKSAKFHIRRILGTSHLTYEELATLFAQIEAILNSRPLSPLSSSPNDYGALTPGHFLLGRPLTSLPAPDLLDQNPRRLDRFRLLEQLRQHFWQRWQKEYVVELQHRTKWRTRTRDLKQGELVILKEDNLPPLLWRLGRVHQLHPGTDGVPRVADITTSRGIVRRALNRMCPLHDS